MRYTKGTAEKVEFKNLTAKIIGGKDFFGDDISSGTIRLAHDYVHTTKNADGTTTYEFDGTFGSTYKITVS